MMVKQPWLWIVLQLWAVVFAAPAIANGQPPLLDIGKAPNHQHPGLYSLWLRDVNCSYSLDSVAALSWSPSEDDIPNFGYSHDCNWLWLKVYNGSAQSVSKLLHIEKFHINELRVWLKSSKGEVTAIPPTGVDYPFASRYIAHRLYLFPLNLSAGDTLDVYVMLRNNGGTISAPLSIYDSHFLYNNDNTRVLGMGFMAGLMALIVVFNFLVFLSIREKVYLYYSFYTLSVMLVLLNNEGYFFQYLWPNVPWLANFSRALLAMVILGSFIRLGQHFLRIRQHYPLMDAFLQWVGYIIIVIMVLATVFQTHQWARQGFIAGMQIISLLVPVMLVVAYLLYFKLRQQQQLVYIIAFTPAIVYLVVLNLLIATGYLPINEFFFYGLYVCIIFEVLVMSTFLVINLKHIEVEKNKLLKALNAEQSRQFSIALEASEEERKRIARELHDGLGQLLSTIKLYMSGFDEAIHRADGEHAEQYRSALYIIDEATNEVRNISHNLMPSSLIQLGLASAIQGMARQLNGAGEIKVWHEVEGDVARLADTVEISLYRIAQEIVNNILKHAQAQNIWIKLIYNKSTLTLHIKDDGIGMDIEKLNQGVGIGWSNIFSRVTMLKGEHQIYSANNRGTIVEITVNIAYHGGNPA